MPVEETVEGNIPFVSIIVPLRDEERNAMFCVESLLLQKYPNFEVIAFNDMSKDNTLKILKELASRYNNLKVIDGIPKPEGWVGKIHALWQGVKNSKGEWLLFVDADINTDPYTLTSAINYVEKNKVDMLSLNPFHILRTFWEKVIQSIILTSIYYDFPQKKINDQQSKIAAAIGGFIFISRSVYEATGGHMALKDRIVEDFALANLVKSSGYRLNVMGGKKLVRVRWYENFSELWEGWTKNVFFGLGRNMGKLVFAIFALLAWGVIPVILFLWTLFLIIFREALSSVVYIICFESLFLLILAILNSLQAARLFSIPRYYSLTFPLGVLGFVAIMLSSAYKVVSGVGVTWKGRVYRF
ncbi:glycosyltransferase [Desulfobacterota bacterium AH_259_B03_O07]|nr:glycosyltransferase [Desulfobacterota bacterium AH_259_B03_O07]